VLGASLELDFFHNGYHVHFNTDVFGNFALISPFALDIKEVSDTDLRRARIARQCPCFTRPGHAAKTICRYGPPGGGAAAAAL
jgi:hypothetical protein